MIHLTLAHELTRFLIYLFNNMTITKRRRRQQQQQLLLLLDCVQRAQTSDKASNNNQKWSGVRIPISGLTRIRIWMPAGSLPKCRGFIALSVSVISISVVKIARWLWEMLINPKIAYSAMVREVEKWSGICIRDRITTKT